MLTIMITFEWDIVIRLNLTICQIPIINSYFYTLSIDVPHYICDQLKNVVEGYTNHMSAVVYVRGYLL